VRWLFWHAGWLCWWPSLLVASFVIFEALYLARGNPIVSTIRAALSTSLPAMEYSSASSDKPLASTSRRHGAVASGSGQAPAALAPREHAAEQVVIPVSLSPTIQ
jgi:hypothetical protein